MARQGARSWFQRLGDRLGDRLLALRQVVPAVDLAWELGVRFRRRNGSVLVGHLAYRLFLFIVPLMLVLVSGFGFAAASDIDIVALAEEAGVTASTATDAVGQAERGRLTALVVGIPALAVATWGIVRGMHYAYAQAWALEIRARRGIGRDIAATLVGVIVLSIAFLVLGVIQRQGVLLAFGGWVGSVAVMAGALWLICRALPRRTDRALDLLPGPVIAALALSAVHVFAAIYLPARLQSSSVVYGALAIAMAVLFHMFLIAYILVFMPFVNSVWVDRSQILAGRPWIVDVERLPLWSRRAARWASARPRREREPDEQYGSTPPADERDGAAARFLRTSIRPEGGPRCLPRSESPS